MNNNSMAHAEIAARVTVEVAGPSEALTVGPDEVLVVVFPNANRGDLEHIRSRLTDSMLRPDQILLIAGYAQLAKAHKDASIVLQGRGDVIDGTATT